MDIRNWPLDRIMQLPDCCFGQKWLISLSVTMPSAAAVFVISPAGLPESFVIWEMFATGCLGTAVSVDCTLALGDVLPTTDAEFGALELVFPGMVSRTRGAGTVEIIGLASVSLRGVRKAVRSAGRRFVCRFIQVDGAPATGQLFLVISSIPTEVPDWLISGPGRSQ